MKSCHPSGRAFSEVTVSRQGGSPLWGMSAIHKQHRGRGDGNF